MNAPQEATPSQQIERAGHASSHADPVARAAHFDTLLQSCERARKRARDAKSVISVSDNRGFTNSFSIYFNQIVDQAFCRLHA